MTKLSIVIPVYNVERYLEECLKSIINQQYKDYEILLINDGSTDYSGEICERYSEVYSNIKLFHKDNGGLADTRNFGIRKARGEYILFIDSDDYINRGSLNEIIRITEEDEEADVIFLKAVKVFPNGEKERLDELLEKDRIYQTNKNDVIDYVSNLAKFPASACTKLVKKDFIIKNKLYFKKGLLSEDIDWSIQLVITANKFNCCTAEYYNYRQARVGSITNKKNKKNIEDLFYIIKKWASLNEDSNEYQVYINRIAAYEYIILLSYYGNRRKEFDKQFKKKLKKYDWLLKKSQNKKVELIKKVYRILGLNLTSSLLSIYLKKR